MENKKVQGRKCLSGEEGWRRTVRIWGDVEQEQGDKSEERKRIILRPRKRRPLFECPEAPWKLSHLLHSASLPIVAVNIQGTLTVSSFGNISYISWQHLTCNCPLAVMLVHVSRLWSETEWFTGVGSPIPNLSTAYHKCPGHCKPKCYRLNCTPPPICVEAITHSVMVWEDGAFRRLSRLDEVMRVETHDRICGLIRRGRERELSHSFPMKTQWEFFCTTICNPGR